VIASQQWLNEERNLNKDTIFLLIIFLDKRLIKRSRKINRRAGGEKKQDYKILSCRDTILLAHIKRSGLLNKDKIILPSRDVLEFISQHPS
jgi:hypothetical protein